MFFSLNAIFRSGLDIGNAEQFSLKTELWKGEVKRVVRRSSLQTHERCNLSVRFRLEILERESKF